MAFKGYEAHATYYLKNSVPAAPGLTLPGKEVALTENEETHHMHEDLGTKFEYPCEFNGAEEYAAYGWAKWTRPKSRTTWHLLFRVTVNNNGKNMSNLGDRTLSVWVGNGILHFTTCNFITLHYNIIIY